jgi:tRNA modification GTPase
MPPAPDIICAPATAEGVAALAVVRVSGAGACGMVGSLLSLEPGRLSGMRRKVALLMDGERPVDRVVALSWPPGSSYTGEEMVEIICHGVPAIVARIMDLLQNRGARLAAPGEFTRRALASGSLSPLEVLALAEILGGEGRGEELVGRLRESSEQLLDEVRACMDALEGDMEFGDLNPDAGIEDVSAMGERARASAETLLELAASIEGVPRVVLMGPVNSGKSTLFNLLTGADALVSAEPGTTRDGASRTVTIRGRPIRLCDSAGTGGEGLDRLASSSAITSISPGDRVVWMSVRGEEPLPEAIRIAAWEVIEISGKSDLSEEGGGESLRVSSRTGEGIEALKIRIASAPGSATVSGLAERAIRGTELAQDAIRAGDLPVAAVRLQEIEDAVTQILGEGQSMTLSIERALERLCVGK